jgi:hypothetical protein
LNKSLFYSFTGGLLKKLLVYYISSIYIYGFGVPQPWCWKYLGFPLKSCPSLSWPAGHARSIYKMSMVYKHPVLTQLTKVWLLKVKLCEKKFLLCFSVRFFFRDRSFFRKPFFQKFGVTPPPPPTTTGGGRGWKNGLWGLVYPARVGQVRNAIKI